MIEFRPVLAKDGSVLLYDIFINGVWHGSRRLIAQCQEQVRNAN